MPAVVRSRLRLAAQRLLRALGRSENAPPGQDSLFSGKLFALNSHGLGLLFPAGEAGLLEGVEHGGVPVPGGVGHGLVESTAELGQLVAGVVFNGVLKQAESSL